jgi:hypothetical protein
MRQMGIAALGPKPRTTKPAPGHRIYPLSAGRRRRRAAESALRLVNARKPSAVIEEITQAGLDIDQGMVVKMGGQLYYGADAIHTLALLSSRLDLFNKLSYYAFRSKTLSRILYPGLRTCRNLLLKIMATTKINNLRVAGNDRF